MAFFNTDAACFQLPVNGSNHTIHITTVHSVSGDSVSSAEIHFSDSIYYGIGHEVARGVYFATVNMGYSIIGRYTCLVYGNPAMDKNTLISSLKKADRDGKQSLKIRDSPLIISVDTIIEALAQFASEYRAMNIHIVEVSDNFKDRLRELGRESQSDLVVSASSYLASLPSVFQGFAPPTLGATGVIASMIASLIVNAVIRR